MKEKVLTLGTIRDYILVYFPDLLWWDGYNPHEPFNPSRSYKHRQGMPNEIRIEFDYEDNKKNWEAINFVAIELNKLNYSFAIFYTEGGRGPHLHIYDLDELESLSYEQRTLYREKFLTKICNQYYQPDKALCDEKHLCALEFANHFKYDKPKQLLSYFWNGRNQGSDFEIKQDIAYSPQKLKKLNISKDQSKLKFGERLMQTTRDKIIENLSFETVLDKYNISYRGHMAQCPFHNDTNNSLSFCNGKGLWRCFGCDSKGDIITLIKMLKEKEKSGLE
jgi:hypothetical protein